MGNRRKGGRVVATGVVRTLPYDPALVFGVLSDSNRWDRLMGVPPTRYTVEALDPGRPGERTRVGRIGRPSRTVSFVEDGEYWAPRRLFGQRLFLGRFARWMPRAFLEVEAVPDGAGTRVTMQGGAEVRTLMGWALGVMMWLRVWVALRRYLRDVERLLGVASGSQIAMLAHHAAHPGVMVVLDDQGATLQTIEARLRGLRDSYPVVIALREVAALEDHRGQDQQPGDPQQAVGARGGDVAPGHEVAVH